MEVECNVTEYKLANAFSKILACCNTNSSKERNKYTNVIQTTKQLFVLLIGTGAFILQQECQVTHTSDAREPNLLILLILIAFWD